MMFAEDSLVSEPWNLDLNESQPESEYDDWCLG